MVPGFAFGIIRKYSSRVKESKQTKVSGENIVSKGINSEAEFGVLEHIRSAREAIVAVL